MPGESFAEYHEIDALFSTFGSDRGSSGHIAKGFHKLYGALFTARRLTTDLLVEVGYGGAGLRTWSHFFARAQVLGVHNQPNDEIKGEERIITVVCDPASRFVKPKDYWTDFIGNKLADIIIDASVDEPSKQGQALENMYDSLRDGGFYVVEGFRAKPHCIGGCHHFCNMVFNRPFDGASSKDFSVKPRIFESSDVFYTSMQYGQTVNNNMVLMKNWLNYQRPFHDMKHNYHVVYNALLSSMPIRNIMSYRVLEREIIGNAACSSESNGIDIFIVAAESRRAISSSILKEFSRSDAGSYLFVEETSFSYCQGAPDPSHGYWGDGISGIVSSNPDWFYAMTEDDSVRSGKMLVIRKA
jgi:hypothetical protein